MFREAGSRRGNSSLIQHQAKYPPKLILSPKRWSLKWLPKKMPSLLVTFPGKDWHVCWQWPARAVPISVQDVGKPLPKSLPVHHRSPPSPSAVHAARRAEMNGPVWPVLPTGCSCVQIAACFRSCRKCSLLRFVPVNPPCVCPRCLFHPLCSKYIIYIYMSGFEMCNTGKGTDCFGLSSWVAL